MMIEGNLRPLLVMWLIGDSRSGLILAAILDYGNADYYGTKGAVNIQLEHHS